QQVVLAQAVEVDVLDDDHLVVVDGEQGIVEHGVDVRVVPARQESERLLDPCRRPEQPFAIRVFAKLHQEPRDEIFHALIVQTSSHKSQGSSLRNARTPCTLRVWALGFGLWALGFGSSLETSDLRLQTLSLVLVKPLPAFSP